MIEDVILLRVAWPEQALWANRPTHWAAKSRAKRKARKEAWAKGLEQNIKRLDTDSPSLEFTFHPPKGRGRLPDPHNMPATMKAHIDGVADALGCDDKKFRCKFPEKLAARVEGGAVLIEIRR